MSHEIVNDTYRLDVCLTHPPYLVAIAAIYVACNFQEKEYRTWFRKLNVEHEQVSPRLLRCDATLRSRGMHNRALLCLASALDAWRSPSLVLCAISVSRFSTSVASCCSCGTRPRATRRPPPTRASSRCSANSTRKSLALWLSCTLLLRQRMRRHSLQPIAPCRHLQPRPSRHRRLPLGPGPRRRSNPLPLRRIPMASATRNACACRFDARTGCIRAVVSRWHHIPHDFARLKSTHQRREPEFCALHQGR